MKKFLTLITMMALIIQVFHMGIIEAEFFMNQEKITRELCENKDKPELQCKGHCQLKKELEKKSEPQSQRQFNEMSFFIGCEDIYIPQSNPVLKIKTTSHSCYFYAQEYITEIFHPPGIALFT